DCGVVPEHLPLELPQPLARLDTQLRDQRLPRLTIRSERFGLSAGAVQGEHELSAHVFAIGMLRDQDFELGDQLAGAPESEVRLDTVFERLETKLVQSASLRRDGFFVDYVFERLP